MLRFDERTKYSLIRANPVTSLVFTLNADSKQLEKKIQKRQGFLENLSRKSVIETMIQELLSFATLGTKEYD